MSTPNDFDLQVMQMAMELVKSERIRQVQHRNCTMTRDDGYVAGELGDASAAYMRKPEFHALSEFRQAPGCWPSDSSKFKPIVVRAKDVHLETYTEGRIAEVIKGAALAVAELERLMRADLRKPEPESQLILPSNVLVLPGRMS